MQALKGLVIGLGILIIVSFVLLFYGFYVRLTDPDFAIMREEPEETRLFSELNDLPEGRFILPPECEIIEMRPDGGRIYLRTGPAGVCERIFILHGESGRQVAVLNLRP